jgi:predicted membrane channel-forming protein YqfA (hemolysin III family)
VLKVGLTAIAIVVGATTLGSTVFFNWATMDAKRRFNSAMYMLVVSLIVLAVSLYAESRQPDPRYIPLAALLGSFMYIGAVVYGTIGQWQGKWQAASPFRVLWTGFSLIIIPLTIGITLGYEIKEGKVANYEVFKKTAIYTKHELSY